MSDQNWYYCEHDVYYEDDCYLCTKKQKEIESTKKFYVEGLKNRCLNVVESLRTRLQDVNGTVTPDQALKQVWEEINKL